MRHWKPAVVAALVASLASGVCLAQETSTYLYDVHGRLVSNGTAVSTTNSNLSLYSYDGADNRTVRQSVPYGPRPNLAYLTGGETLVRGQAAVSGDGQSRLTFQQDGALVVTCNGVVQLTLYGLNGDAAYLQMQADGNLVLYNVAIAPLWSSGTGGNAGAFLSVQDDGNVVIYSGATPLWATATSC